MPQLKLALFEWICGGGIDHDQEEVSTSLLVEGAAMLRCIISEALAAGYDVRTAVSSSCLAFARELHQIGCNVRTIEGDETLEQWLVLAKGCDVSIVVAPESGGILGNITSAFLAAGVRVAGCSGAFLENASDKWLTAGCLASTKNGLLQQRGGLHPLTWLISDFPMDQDRGDYKQWIVKPRDGVGCEGIRIVESPKLDQAIEALSKDQELSNYIIQPRMPGIAASCSAIVDCTGHAHWLPLATQQLTGDEHLSYRGGTFNPVDRVWQRPDELLETVIQALGSGALGWIGVDLVYDEAKNRWTIIEINPRCTSSILGATRCSSANLIQAWVTAAVRPINLEATWGTGEFSVDVDFLSL